jgi:hypothetical protein
MCGAEVDRRRRQLRRHAAGSTGTVRFRPGGVCGSDVLDAIQAEASVALAEVRQVYKALQA